MRKRPERTSPRSSCPGLEEVGDSKEQLEGAGHESLPNPERSLCSAHAAPGARREQSPPQLGQGMQLPAPAPAASPLASLSPAHDLELLLLLSHEPPGNAWEHRACHCPSPSCCPGSAIQAGAVGPPCPWGCCCPLAAVPLGVRMCQWSRQALCSQRLPDGNRGPVAVYDNLKFYYEFTFQQIPSYTKSRC